MPLISKYRGLRSREARAQGIEEQGKLKGEI